MKREKVYDIIFVGIIIVFFLRAPQLIIQGRFWAEEGSYYFQYAYHHNFLETIAYIFDKCGYYYLWTNISVLFASLVPLEYAPAVATWLAFAMNVVIYAYIYYMPSCVLKSKYSKIWFSLIMVLGAHMTAEVYCNSVNSQVFFGLFMVCYFFRDIDAINQLSKKARRGFRIVTNILLIIACLSGLYGLILFPWFVIRYWRNRKTEDRETILLMLAPLVIQALAVLFSAGESASRFFEPSMQAINNTVRYIIAVPVLGNENAGKISLVAVYLLLLAALVGLFFIEKRIKKRIIPQLVGIFLYYFIFVMVCGLGGNGAGGRYAIVPSGVLLLLFIYVFENCIGKLGKAVGTVLIILPLWFGILEYQSPKNYAALDYNNAPNWENEVQAYMRDSSYDLVIWPYQKDWRISLDESDEK